jgi:hypothetical protein
MMTRKGFRLMAALMLAGAGLRATPITGVTLADPSLVTPAEMMQVVLGNGLIWEGPALSPEEWSERMKGLPPAAGFGGGAESLVAPDVASPTPEPSTLLMMGAGIVAGLWWRRRS